MQSKKRHKKRFRLFILKTIVFLLILFLAFKGLSFLTNSKEERELKKLNYSNEAITLIIDNKIDKYLINNNLYSKTLEVALTEGQYESKLLEEYVYFPYKDYDGYITQLNELNLIGYKREDIEQVFKVLDKNEINTIIKKETVINNLVNYINNEYFEMNSLDRYVQYKKDHSAYEYDKVVAYVNMFLDYDYYDHTIDVKQPDELLVIVNKYYKLSSGFIPKGLVKIDSKNSYNNYEFWVLPVVKENFMNILSDMKKVGLEIQVKSAYRSYQTQVDSYNDYVRSNGKEATDTFSARAGYSEHQTGLAIDVKATDGTYSTFVTSKEYDWMKNNAHKYGFIMRYPEDKTDITGYKFESWHFRYVGNDIAKYIYEKELTFDEYYARFIANKKTNN